MIDHKKQMAFIELRASGMSHARIAEELGISKQTSINLAASLKTDIVNMRSVMKEEITETYRTDKMERLRFYVSCRINSGKR